MNNSKSSHISTISLDYAPDLALTLFSPIAEQSWSMLLRSASSSHPDSRYDVLVAQPIATLVTTDKTTEIKHQGSLVVSTNDPFSLVQEYLDILLPATKDDSELPFVGGALGYFGYDLGRRVETLPCIAKKDINVPDMAVGLYEWAVIVDHHNKTACMVGLETEKNLDWLLSQEQPVLSRFILLSDWQSNMTKRNYVSKFNVVQEYLHSGDCYQINLAQRFRAQYQGSIWQAYCHLEKANQAPFSAFIKLKNNAVLSVSPERFLQIKDRKIETKPIKGTRPRSDNPVKDMENVQDLVNTEKDQAENLMIVDLLRNDIGRVAKPGTVQVPLLFEVESFPAVHHLVSTVVAELDDEYNATDCLRACFPGGSITGAPKVRAMEIIEELEPHRRSIYCGSIGYINRSGGMDSSITIRTLVANDQNLYAWAGGGLVADSQAESEYQETLDKLSKILPILADS
ncbi:aminodeoxychorismate synthase component I [Vibrio algarum]|uniref:aminodeoxychorismate synthase n=1 Tax=Vibrio algarum TaxID=3020714 RepID=A0ABT4YQD5_9VIBR|nr:aminodeoxychorismate synthase component I [Vibrio sp. KJ40-1]MDB1123773.1 aminodeoxychorismate synthase component I [Vibrio sp. KJ40-1]